MDARIAIQKLLTTLEELAKHYGQLLDVVRKERDLLLTADLEALALNNEEKEILIGKTKLADQLRLKVAAEAARAVGADAANPRLLEIAAKAQGPEADRLRGLHGALETLIARVSEINRDNEIYARKALDTLNGAMNNIKDSLSGKKTYGGKGQYKQGPQVAGNFVSKEA